MHREARILAAGLIIGLSLGICLAVGAAPVRAASPAWVEPRALNIFDLAGLAPEDALRDHIVVYGGGGLAIYQSGERNGAQVRVTVRLYPRRFQSGGRWLCYVPMLGQRPVADHMGSAAPESWLRLYAGAQEVTQNIWRMDYQLPDLTLPERDASQAWRYPSTERKEVPLTPTASGARLPANWGGEVLLWGDYRELTGVYTAEVSGSPTVTYLGTQVETFASYIGPGGVGYFQPLMEQLKRTYAFRHPRIRLNAPAAANYILFAYPPTPFDVYDWTPDKANLDRPSGGTLRLAPDEGKLSQDLTHGGAFPLRAAWMDADQSAGPYLSLLPPIDRITPPEYVVPAGIAYDPCFLTGKCGASTLQAIYAARMTMRIVYLRVEPNAERVLAVPLRAADNTWRPSGARIATWPRAAPQLGQTLRAYLPYVTHRVPYVGVERPAGLFDPTTGRMVGYLAPE